MIYLLLAILSSALVSITMRVSEKYVRNNISMLSGNYVMCSVLAALFTGVRQLFPAAESGFSFTLLFGLLCGLLYLVSFMMLQFNIKTNGMILSSVFMKLGVLVPTLMSGILFREQPRVLQMIGFCLAIAAIVLINMEKGSKKAASSAALILLLLTGGVTDATSKIFEELGPQALKNHFLLYTFMAAFIFSVAVCLIKKQKLTWLDLGFGLLLGIPNYFSARFLLLSLAEIPAMIAYPSFSVATIVVVTLAGALVFREKLSRRQMAAILVILGALVLLNI